MSNAQKKKLAAAKHNFIKDEHDAYIEDKLRDPDKYKRRYSKRMSSFVAVGVAMAAMNNSN